MKKAKIFYFAALGLLMAACSEDNDDNNNANNNGNGNLQLAITQLEPVTADERYEGWIIVDGNPVSTGLFTVGSDGSLSQTSFEVAQSDLSAATDFVLTIEPYPDMDPAPSKIKVLGGMFNGNSAMVNVSHPAALGADFNTASGDYILATPTTNDTTDERSGVWFLDPTGPSATLNLPSLPAEWVYEGWAVIDGVPVSTGRFSSVSGADQGAPFSGTDNPGPPFPGEDFIMNAPNGLTFPVDLSSSPIVISIEPEPDNSPAPFAFKPLFGMAPANAAVHSLHSLNNQTDMNFPKGSVSR